MKIFINAVALKVGGGKSVLLNFLSQLSKTSGEHEYLVALPEHEEFKAFERPDIKMIFVKHTMNKPWLRWYVNKKFVLGPIHSYQPDIIFSMGNIGLKIRKYPQVVLLQFAYVADMNGFFWKTLKRWQKFYYRYINAVIISRVKYSKALIVQTNTVKNNLLTLYNLKVPIEVVPNGRSLSEDHVWKDFKLDSSKRKFLCFTRYYSHKNLEIFIDVGRLIRIKKLPYQIILTINRFQHVDAARLLQQIKANSLEDIIVNVGEIEHREIKALYSQTDALILPTFIESFSGTFIEAAAYNKPIFTSKLDFAIEVCGSGAIYFNMNDPEDILKWMAAIEDKKLMANIVEIAQAKILSYPNWELVTNHYIDILRQYS